jgi:GTP cyclohydrolase II
MTARFCLTQGRRLHTLIDIKQIAEVKFPTRWAVFRLLAFESSRAAGGTGRRESAVALILGDIQSVPPLVRIHSQCVTGEVFHSLRCDCRGQLKLALESIAQSGAGLLIYEQQEGRGIGLIEKLRAYELQDQGLDTVDANLRLGHDIDSRNYELPVAIIRFLQIRSLRLITNNPEKLMAVNAAGITIVERIAADTEITSYAEAYVATKQERLGHLLPGAAPYVPLRNDLATHLPISKTNGSIQPLPLARCLSQQP